MSGRGEVTRPHGQHDSFSLVDNLKRSVTALSPLDAAVLHRNVSVVRGDVPGLVNRARRVAFYTRYSTLEQKVASIERQVAVNGRYLRMLGLSEYKLYKDIGQSARSAVNRADLQRLLEDCKNDEIDMIVVEDFDRWSREIYDAVEIAEQLERLGIEFHCAAEERRLTKEDVVQAALRAERDRIRRRNLTTAGRMQLALEAGVPSGPFFGYRKAERRGYLVQDKTEADVIKSVFEMADAGMSLRKIADRLVAEGAIGPSGRCHWPFTTIQAILAQPMYTGRVVYGRTESIYDRQTQTTTLRPRPLSEVALAYSEDYRIVSDEVFMRVRDRAGGPRGALGKPTKLGLLGARGHCDCPGAASYAFTASGCRLSCTNHRLFGSCGQPTASLPLRAVELGVIRAVVDRLRSSNGEVGFAEAFRKARLAAHEVHLAQRASMQARIDEINLQLDRMLDDDINERYDARRIARREQALQAELDELSEKLRTLGPRVADPVDPAGPFADLASALEGIEQRLPFKVETEADAAFYKAFRRIVKRVDVLREGRPVGDVRLVVHVDFGAWLEEADEDPGVAGETEAIVVDIELSHSQPRHRRVRDDAAELLARGGYELTDAQWELVGGILPDVTSLDPATRDLTTRQVADALMLRMHSGHSVTSKTPVDSQAIANALKRFVYAGGDRILLDVLGSDDPAWLEGLDLRVLQRARTLYNVACSGRTGRLPDALRVRALDGKTALTDEEWRAAAPLIDPRVALGPGDPDGPEVRDLIEAVLLKLRTKVPWWKLPDRFGDPDVLYGLVRRLVRSGSWAGLFDLWCREHPHLVEGLDAGPLDRLQRGWPRFGHGEAGLTRRRKRRIAEVAAMPKGDGA